MTLPGPGNYTHQKEFGHDAKSFSMRGRPQDKVGNEVPGPGNYEGNLEVVKDKVISYNMGSGQNRSMLVSKEASNLPGPGHYDSPTRQSGPNVRVNDKFLVYYGWKKRHSP